jgi:hypothetical protein
MDKKDVDSETNIIMGVIYCRPGSDVNNFNEILNNSLNIIKKENKESIHCSDYNFVEIGYTCPY